MTTETTGGGRKMVRIWLGDHLIAEYAAEPDRASRYQRVMTPKFTGLRITVDNAATGKASELPSEQLWPLTVQ
ncbi:hypothetical protein [Kribbella sp. NPDC048928]|jgi:hypothetical protein|uniref:hypothetical protein n=1 Tax=Kribbella sp. NPDC048928 TaxID=3364111 RepID=UPI0037240926